MKENSVMKTRVLAIGLIAGALALQLVPEAEAVSALDMFQCKLSTLQYQVGEKVRTAVEKFKTVAVECDAELKAERIDFENQLSNGVQIDQAFEKMINEAEDNAHQTYWRAESECWKNGKTTKFMSSLQERGICGGTEQKAVKVAKDENRLMKKAKEVRRLVKERLIHPVMEKARAVKNYVKNRVM